MMRITSLFYLVFWGIVRTSARDSGVRPRDGPIGLPGHVLLRNSGNRMRRHMRKIVNHHSPEIEELNREFSGNKPEYRDNLSQMSDLIHNNQEYSILDTNQLYYNYDFSFIPEWFNALPPEMDSAKGFVMDSLASMAHMGLMALISTDVFQNAYCSIFSSDTDKAICLRNAVENINKIAKMGSFPSLTLSGKQIMSLNFRVLSGGRTAKEALTTLNTLASNPENVGLIKTLGSTIVMYITLMREIIGDETKALAGSVMTKLTNLPVASNIPDISTGGFGRVNVILPRPSRVHRADYDIAKLKSGGSEKDLLTST